MSEDYEGVIVKQVESELPRDIDATVRYMVDLKNHGHKLGHDELGPLSGSVNCIGRNRKEQLREFNHYLRLHGNLRSTQAASHQLVSYPEGVVPTRKQIERDLRVILKKYGMQDHPLVWDAHVNTSNFHVHFLLLRVSLKPDEKGKYPIADGGLVKKTSKKDRGRTRTDWSACRQCAVAEISGLYGVDIPKNVRRTPDGTPRQRQDKKDTHSDKTRRGERKRGEKSKERQLSEAMKEVFDSAIAEASISKTSLWKIVDREFSSRALEMVIKLENGRPVGGYVVGPDNRKCSFSRAGKEYSVPALVRRFGAPSLNDQAFHTEYDFEPFEYHERDLTAEEAKKRLLPVFRAAVDSETWTSLIEGVQQQGMALKRSGGGLVVLYNDGRDTIKASDISNKFSLSRIEKILGPCPLPKVVPAQLSARDILTQDATAIISRYVARGRGLFQIHPSLQAIGIQIERKAFTMPDGERIKYCALVRDGISIPLSACKDAYGDPYTMRQLRFLDLCDPSAQHAAWLAWVADQSDNYRRRHKAALAQPSANMSRALPGVPFLDEIKNQIVGGYHHVSRIIGIIAGKDHYLEHAAEIPGQDQPATSV